MTVRAVTATAWVLCAGLAWPSESAFAQIRVSPGQSVQAAVDVAPEGASFTIAAGIHRFQSVRPKRGQRFQGEPGAVLSGARLLTSFSREGSYWVATGQTQQGAVMADPEGCAEPRCGYPEDLFINNVLLEHVAGLSAVGPGKWHFDYPADKIYFWDDPTGKTVEASVTPNAFVASFVPNVTIKWLVIEKYATPSPMGAIESYVGWVIEGNELRFNHNAAIRNSGQDIARANYIHHNGGYGLLGAGLNILIEGNEIAYNNTAGYNMWWGAGGSKWVYTTGLIVRNNFSHHNKGHGLWTDINNIDTLYEGNRVEDNDSDGIFHEISYKAIIRNNICRRNGVIKPFPGWVSGSGILVFSSPNVEIYGNTVADNFNGITALDAVRGTGTHGPWRLTNLYVHDNDVSMVVGVTGVVVLADTAGEAFKPAANNRFHANRYTVGPNARYFRWNGDRTFAEWQALGFDRLASAPLPPTNVRISN